MHTITRNSVATNSRIATNLIHYFAMLEIVEKREIAFASFRTSIDHETYTLSFSH